MVQRVSSKRARLAYQEFMRHLAAYLDRPEQIPCLGRNRGDWTNDQDQHAIARAVAGCRTCPLLAECRQYAKASLEPAGVWGGVPAHVRRPIVAKLDAA